MTTDTVSRLLSSGNIQHVVIAATPYVATHGSNISSGTLRCLADAYAGVVKNAFAGHALEYARKHAAPSKDSEHLRDEIMMTDFNLTRRYPMPLLEAYSDFTNGNSDYLRTLFAYAFNSCGDRFLGDIEVMHLLDELCYVVPRLFGEDFDIIENESVRKRALSSLQGNNYRIIEAAYTLMKANDHDALGGLASVLVRVSVRR